MMVVTRVRAAGDSCAGPRYIAYPEHGDKSSARTLHCGVRPIAYNLIALQARNENAAVSLSRSVADVGASAVTMTIDPAGHSCRKGHGDM